MPSSRLALFKDRVPIELYSTHGPGCWDLAAIMHAGGEED